MREYIRGVYVCIPLTREGNIVQYEYPVNTEVNEMVNESNIRSISQHTNPTEA